jgi:hypothetical protein
MFVTLCLAIRWHPLAMALLGKFDNARWDWICVMDMRRLA